MQAVQGVVELLGERLGLLLFFESWARDSSSDRFLRIEPGLGPRDDIVCSQ